MKNEIRYVLDSVYVNSDNAAAASRQMSELRNQGWKDIEIHQHNSWGDTRPPEIYGDRPMTSAELKEEIKSIEKIRKQELKKLRKMAKQYGYKLIKEIK